MIVILFAEVRVTKISATTFVNGFSSYNILEYITIVVYYRLQNYL